MDFTFAEALATLSHLAQDQSVLLRGDHGIGKSELVKQYAQANDLHFIDVRLSQMTEGDLLGLYSIEGDQTKQHLHEWYTSACERPSCLLFDEINRALPGVMQGAFQIVLDRQLGNRKLHPQTKIVAAVNLGNEYDVNEIEPALLDRFCVIDLSPTPAEFFSYARGSVHQDILGFLEQSPASLEVPPMRDTVTPSRRSWVKFSKSYDPDFPHNRKLASSFVGDAAADAFTIFVAGNRRKTISLEQFLQVGSHEEANKLISTMAMDNIIMLGDQLTEGLLKGADPTHMRYYTLARDPELPELQYEMPLAWLDTKQIGVSGWLVPQSMVTNIHKQLGGGNVTADTIRDSIAHRTMYGEMLVKE